MSMMETMLRNPEMQKMLYPYLPEPMRNPSSIEWMLNNPEVKKQMAQMFESQNMMSPQMMEMMKGMDFNQVCVRWCVRKRRGRLHCASVSSSIQTPRLFSKAILDSFSTLPPHAGQGERPV